MTSLQTAVQTAFPAVYDLITWQQLLPAFAELELVRYEQERNIYDALPEEAKVGQTPELVPSAPRLSVHFLEAVKLIASQKEQTFDALAAENFIQQIQLKRLREKSASI